jgi:flagellar assembly protein FliH
MHRTEGGHFQPESVLQDQIHALQRSLAELELAATRREQEARQAGFREGEAAGRKQATDQVQPVLDKMGQSIREISELRPKLRHEAETDVVKLATAIARKILHRELNADPESLSALIRVAMEKIRLHELVRVRVHPQHHAAVQQSMTRITLGAQVELQPDPRLQVGGVVIETTRGEFDASVETQLREIERGLTDRLAHAAR